MIIGRSNPYRDKQPDLDLSVFDPDNSVSNLHAEIWLLNGVWRVLDLGSMNGTYINGDKLVPTHANELHNGDIVTFGKVSLEFQNGKLRSLGRRSIITY